MCIYVYTYIYTFIYIYIYIYIYAPIYRYAQSHKRACTHTHTYIYCHPLIDCFIESQLFSVARNVGRFVMGLKHAQLFIRLCIFLLSHQSTYVSSGLIRHYVVDFACLHFTLPDTRVSQFIRRA